MNTPTFPIQKLCQVFLSLTGINSISSKQYFLAKVGWPDRWKSEKGYFCPIFDQKPGLKWQSGIFSCRNLGEKNLSKVIQKKNRLITLQSLFCYGLPYFFISTKSFGSELPIRIGPPWLKNTFHYLCSFISKSCLQKYNLPQFLFRIICFLRSVTFICSLSFKWELHEDL